LVLGFGLYGFMMSYLFSELIIVVILLISFYVCADSQINKILENNH
jgi:hypothetical protein